MTTGHQFTLSAFGDEIAADLAEQLEVMQREGISALEFRGAWGKNILDLSDDEVQTAKALLDARDMRISAIGSPVGKVKITDDFGAHLARFRRALAVANMLDTPRIRIFSFFIPVGENAAMYRTAVMDQMLMLTDLAEEAGVTLWHENEKAIYGDIATRCADIHTTIPSPHLRAAFDPANFIQCGVRPMDEAWPLLADVSTHIHIKDAVLADGHVVPAGEGDAQVKELLHALVRRGYRGYLTLEPHLKAAGPFGGFSGPELFHTAVKALKGLLQEVEGSNA
ncbi:MAG: sugar phosphate isomerase/epimerase [Thermomicrobia bacterium]|nr:sugar phosphate isomerase/epimerase [Thermomicrobia bacterium]MCA1724340.1 sugar phosphate isomerase/epimerase [Thermomicrobia bacterium]